ncbi:MAG: hypothetical protein IPO22_11870 [Anaerolineales bacterium]|jgi:hypothetical protein|nr:hypothetical protein [Anaerolineales bacterium]
MTPVVAGLEKYYALLPASFLISNLIAPFCIIPGCGFFLLGTVDHLGNEAN